MLPDGSGRHGLCPPERGRSLRERRDRPDAHVLALEELQPLDKRLCREDGFEVGGERVLTVRLELACGELGPIDQLAEPRKNFGSSAPTVRCRASAVA